MKGNGGKLEDEMIEDGNLYDGESTEITARLTRNVTAATERYFKGRKGNAVQAEEKSV